MRTVLLGPLPRELDALIARRHAQGLDTHDEVWKGDYHTAPAAHPAHGDLDQQLAELVGPMGRAVGLHGTGPFNLGDAVDYRVPDRGWHRIRPSATFVSTAAMVIEIVSPHDETWLKLDFYAVHGVDELVIVSPGDRAVTWLVFEDGRYFEARDSRLLGAASHDLADRIDWPPTEEQPAPH